MYLVWRPSVTIEYQIIAPCSTVEKQLNSFEVGDKPDLALNAMFNSKVDWSRASPVSGSNRVVSTLASSGLEVGPLLRNSELRVEIRIAAYITVL